MYDIYIYIDPGSGSLLFQALLSAFLTIALFFKNIVTYVKYLFGKKKGINSDSTKDAHDNSKMNDRP